MADYTTILGDLPSKIASSKRILLALSKNLSVDSLASALALALALQKMGKTVSVVSEGSPLVSHSHLYGIGDVKNSVPTAGEGNFVIKLEGVVDPSGQMNTVPALEKLDWNPAGSALNLVFHVVPGQRFEPTNVSYGHETSGFDLIIAVDADSLDELGQIYLKNAALFSKSTVVNIDNDPSNSQFGNINIVDTEASSVSEMTVQILKQLGAEMDSDIASNLVAGIYAATNNLTQRVNPDTFAAVSFAMQSGGKLPEGGVVSQPEPVVAQPVQSQPIVESSVQTETNQIQFNSQTSAISPQPSATQPVVETVQSQPVAQPAPVQPVAAQPEATPQNDLYSNPFLNPGGQFSEQSSVVPSTSSGLSSSQPSANPIVAAPQQDTAFSAPATGPTFNFGSIDQPVAASSQPQFAAIVEKTPEQKAEADAVDVSQAMSTIMQAKQQDDAYDLKQVFQVQQMPETPVVANTTIDSAIQHAHPTANIKQPSTDQVAVPQANVVQPTQDSKVQSSPEEKPAGEGVMSFNPEIESTPTPDWLVPKIFKGGSLG